MLQPPVLIPPGPQFWSSVVRTLLAGEASRLSSFRIIVPAYSHAQQFKAALAVQAAGSMIAPRIHTLAGCLSLQLPKAEHTAASSHSARMLTLYDQLRQQAWLKRLFGARSNTDLLPLAQLLLTLADELTVAHLPALIQQPSIAGQLWQAALAKFAPPSQSLLSDEANLVWTLWQSQLDEDDGLVRYFARLRNLAAQAEQALIWISPELPDPIEMAFLRAYAERQTVRCIHLDWRASALPVQLLNAWPEMAEFDPHPGLFDLIDLEQGMQTDALQHIRLCPARSLEQEAQQGAQLVLNWLLKDKIQIAIIAQDRVVARRVAALLARANVQVYDETGWKLSTTRAASALAAWLEVVASNAETMCLLDLLKSPFLVLRPQPERDQAEMVMHIELTLRRMNVLGGWDEVVRALGQADLPIGAQEAPILLRVLRKQAQQYSGRKSMQQWIELCRLSLQSMGMLHSLARDWAGRQVLQMLEQLSLEQGAQPAPALLSFAEWRAMLGMQMENLPYVPQQEDKRVSMLPLNGARLRHFDAVLVLGCDADNLPSQASETLFFANAVRRELNLATRESRQKQQMRDFSEVLLANDEVVLSWQEFKNDEPNPASPWLQRLQLSLQQHQLPIVESLHLSLPSQTLQAQSSQMPRPPAPMLLPEKLSASAYNRFFACPYQFFARQMLQLFGLDDLSDMPEKRDYGDWLHEILQKYHDALLVAPDSDRAELLSAISQAKFEQELSKSAAALAYYARWQKSMPGYLAWAAQHEQQGWHYVQGEQSVERSLLWDGGEVLLKGRIDRIDHHADGQCAVLDYKTSSASSLKTRLKGGEDMQLPFYGLLSAQLEHKPVMAAYVALEAGQGKTETVTEPEFEQRQEQLQQHILRSMQALQQGVGLPANGIEAVCQYCEVRGLCRKGAW